MDLILFRDLILFSPILVGKPMPVTEQLMSATEQLGPGDKSSDSSDRIREFLTRHGGSAVRKGDAGDTVSGISGWSEIYAADGYTLRCDWSRMGGLQEMRFTEYPPCGS
jgi:hypothetical protein